VLVKKVEITQAYYTGVEITMTFHLGNQYLMSDAMNEFLHMFAVDHHGPWDSDRFLALAQKMFEVEQATPAKGYGGPFTAFPLTEESIKKIQKQISEGYGIPADKLKVVKLV
jgi:hypothetical protein